MNPVQFGLFDRPRTKTERFLSFHAKHPEVLDELVRMTYEVKARGRKRIGIRMLWERMRWTFYVERDYSEDFKLNDHYHSHYVRLIIELHPDLADMFELREQRSV